MLPDYCPYVLPTIDFVGGETQEFEFNIFYPTNHKPCNMSGSISSFSIVNIRNKTGEPILIKPMKPGLSSKGDYNVLKVVLEPEETVELSGRYVYQIQIRDVDGTVEIPKQGLLYITNNIDKSFIC